MDGSEVIFYRYFTYDIKFSSKEFFDFVAVPDDLSFIIFKNIFVESLYKFEKIPKKYGKFDVERLKLDLSKYLDSKDYN